MRTIILFLFLSLQVSAQIHTGGSVKVKVGHPGGVTVQHYYYNDAAKMLFGRMATQPSLSVKSAVSMAFDSLQYYHLDDTLDMFYGFIFADSIDSKLNWLSTSYTAYQSANIYFYPYLGFLAQASSSFLNTNYNPYSATKFKQNNACVGYYTVDGLGSTSAILGGYDGTNYNVIVPLGATSGTRAMVNNASYSDYQTVYSPGYLRVANRESSTQIKMYNNGSLINTTAKNSTGVPNKNIYLLTYNNNGTAGTISINYITISFALAGAALSTTQHTKLYQILNRLLAAVNSNPTIHKETALANYKVENYRYNTVFRTLACNHGMRLAAVHDTLYLSLDDGATYPYKRYFDKIAEIRFAHIFPNGNISIGCNKTIYVSTNNLTSIVSVTLKDKAGENYTYHTPVNASYPGRYFYRFMPSPDTIYGNDTILMFGNYANVENGATPLNIYLSIDCGVSWKVAYTFGQNALYKDDGTADGGSTGNLLGDASNSIKCRHIHDISYMRDTTWFMTTGDATIDTSEAGVFTVKYSPVKDSVYVNKIAFYKNDTRFKISGIWPISDSVIFASDVAGSSGGIYKAPYNDFSNTAKHREVYAATTETISMIGSGSNYMALEYNTNKIIFSKDGGNTWDTLQLEGLPQISKLTDAIGYDTDNWFMYTKLQDVNNQIKNICIKIK